MIVTESSSENAAAPTDYQYRCFDVLTSTGAGSITRSNTNATGITTRSSTGASSSTSVGQYQRDYLFVDDFAHVRRSHSAGRQPDLPGGGKAGHANLFRVFGLARASDGLSSVQAGDVSDLPTALTCVHQPLMRAPACDH